MSTKELINISIDKEIRKIAEDVFNQLGINPSEAIELFYRQVALTKELPFSLSKPNQETLKALKELENKENLEKYSSFAELRQNLGV